MSETLSYKDVIQRTGYTTIDDIRVVQYTCIIPVEKPEDMRIGITRLNPDMYKTYRDVCRDDYAAFEDAAYELQEKCAAALNIEG